MTKAARIALLLALAVVAGERLLWPTVASWREDQSSLMWIASHVPMRDWTVGLTSSAEVPNPNGLLFFTRVLTWLPGLYSSGVVMQLGQLACLAYFVTGVCAGVTRWTQLWLFVVVASSFALSASASEPHSQYVLVWANLLYWGIALRALARPTIFRMAALVVLLSVAPAIYLPGVLNTLVWAAIAALVFWKQRTWLPRPQHAIPLAAGVAAGLCAVTYLTWRPYFGATTLTDTIRSVHVVAMPLWRRVLWSGVSVAAAPVTWILRSATPPLGHSIYSDLPQTLSPAFRAGSRVYSILMLLLGLASVWIALIIRDRRFWIVVLPVWLAFGVAPLIGGPRFLLGERQDLFPQFLPLVFASIFIVRDRSRWIDRGLGALVAVQLVAAAISIQSHLAYRGPILTDADAPLAQKRDVVDWIAKDWNRRARERTVAVHFDVGGGKWDWIPRIGRMMPPQYHNPYTVGRGFDYLLEREYGLTNAQEGLEVRTGDHAAYVVNYTFQPPPFGGAGETTVFGRYRVTRRPS